MGDRLWAQEILEKEFPQEQQVEPGTEVLKTDTELGTVPEWLRPLLWEMRLLQGETDKAQEAIWTGKVQGLTVLQFLTGQVAQIGELERQHRMLNASFWFELRRAIPKLRTKYGLVLRKGYKVVKPAPEEPEESEEPEGGNGHKGIRALIIGLLGKKR